MLMTGPQQSTVKARKRVRPGHGHASERYPNQRLITLALSQESVARLREIAVATGATLTEVLRRIVDAALADNALHPAAATAEMVPTETCSAGDATDH